MTLVLINFHIYTPLIWIQEREDFIFIIVTQVVWGSMTTSKLIIMGVSEWHSEQGYG